MHRIFQRHHIPPDEFYRKDRRHKLFMYASEIVAMEEEQESEGAAKKAGARGRRVKRR